MEIWEWEEKEELENIIRLRKMVIQVRVLHVNIYNNKGAEDE